MFIDHTLRKKSKDNTRQRKWTMRPWAVQIIAVTSMLQRINGTHKINLNLMMTQLWICSPSTTGTKKQQGDGGQQRQVSLNKSFALQRARGKQCIRYDGEKQTVGPHLNVTFIMLCIRNVLMNIFYCQVILAPLQTEINSHQGLNCFQIGPLALNNANKVLAGVEVIHCHGLLNHWPGC